MRGRNHFVIAAILLGCSFFNFCNTTDKIKSLVDAETYMKELRDPDPEVQCQAVIGLGQLRYLPAVEYLVTAIRDPKSLIRSQATISLGCIQSSQTVPILIAALDDPTIRIEAARALRSINDPRGIAAIEEYKKQIDECGNSLLEEEMDVPTQTISAETDLSKPIVMMTPAEKSKKIEELWKQYKSDKDLREPLYMLARLGDVRIFNELGSTDESISQSIFYSLRFFHSAEAVNALVSALNRFPNAKEYFTDRTFTFTDPALADALLPLLDSTDETIFALAAHSLIEMREQRAIIKLRSKLLDNDEYIQDIAEIALEELTILSGNDYPADLSSPDDSENDRSQMRQELAKVGPSEIDALITKTLTDPNLPIVRKITAIEMAGESRSSSIIPSLSQILAGRSVRLIDAAAKALARIGDKTSISILLQALQADNFWVRESAADALLSVEELKIVSNNPNEKRDESTLRQWQQIKKWRKLIANYELSNPTANSPADQSNQLLPLAIISENQIVKLSYNRKTNTYLVKNKREAAGIRHIATSDDRVVVGTVNRLFALDKHLTKQAELLLPDIQAIAFAGDTLLAAVGGFLLTFNGELKLIGKIGLAISKYSDGEWKNAHDILAKDRRAYLLDNMIEPVFVLQIGIDHPATPKILSSQRIYDTDQHLSMQFISDKDNTWNVVQRRHAIWEGWFQNLLQFSLANGQPLRHIENEMESKGQEDPEILAVTPEIPGWTVASYGFHIALIRIEKPSDIVYSIPSLHLGIEKESSNNQINNWFGQITANIYQHGELLYITANRQLWVVRTGPTPKIVLHQTLDKPVIKLAVMPE